MSNSFHFNYELDGKNYIVDVEYDFQVKSSVSRHLCDSDQDFDGWFEVLDVDILCEDTNELVEIEVSNERIEKEFFYHVEFQNKLQEEERYVSMQSMFGEDDLNDYYAGIREE